MRRPIKTRKDLDISSDHFLRRNPGYPFGLTFGELDVLRPGWQDDFLGDVLFAQYTAAVNAGGAVTLQDNRHGGVVRLSVPNAAGAYARLFLGNAASGYSTACISWEWFIIIRLKVSALNLGRAIFGAYEVGTNNFYYGGYLPGTSANWLLFSSDNAGASSWTASTVAVDTNWHTLAFRSRTTFLELWLDGALICTHNTNLPTGCMEPFMQASRDTGAMNLDIDWIRIFWR